MTMVTGTFWLLLITITKNQWLYKWCIEKVQLNTNGCFPIIQYYAVDQSSKRWCWLDDIDNNWWEKQTQSAWIYTGFSPRISSYALLQSTLFLWIDGSCKNTWTGLPHPPNSLLALIVCCWTALLNVTVSCLSVISIWRGSLLWLTLFSKVWTLYMTTK